jgi:hypothetical protein
MRDVRDFLRDAINVVSLGHGFKDKDQWVSDAKAALDISPPTMTEGARLKAKEAIRRLRERADEMWLDACVDAHGMVQECALAVVAKPTMAMLHTLCSAIETHPLDRTNDFVENARKRARDFLEENGHE